MDFFPPGIPDDRFTRGEVPIVEAEVRAVVMAKACLRPGMRVLDLGAGTGTFTVEASLLCPDGEVVALECDQEALDLLQRNIAHFALTNVAVIAGEAPEALAGVAPFDRIFLGGFGPRLTEILDALPSCLKPGGLVVATTVGLESTTEIIDRFRQAPWHGWDIVHLAVARGFLEWPEQVRFAPLTPTWVISTGLR